MSAEGCGKRDAEGRGGVTMTGNEKVVPTATNAERRITPAIMNLPQMAQEGDVGIPKIADGNERVDDIEMKVEKENATNTSQNVGEIHVLDGYSILFW